MENIIDNLKNKYVKWNLGEWLWFIYFVVMFNFYTYTYVQLMAQILIVAYTVITISKNTKIKKKDLKSIWKYILWYGLFCLWCICSVKWSVYPPNEESNTLLTVVRIFVIGLCLVYYIRTKNAIDNIIDIFIKSGIFFAILTIISNPVRNWGSEHTFFSFGKGYMRNGIANFSYLFIILIMYNKKNMNTKTYKFLIIVFMGLILMCGSRRAIIMSIILYLLYTITTEELGKRISKIITCITVGIIVLVIAINIPYVKSTYVLRIQQMLMGTNSEDSSTVGRNAYIGIAWDMFLTKPLKGWGVDGFYNYLLDNPYAYKENYKLKAVYSHNNYVELLSCFGLIGTLFFYSIYLKLFFQNVKDRKKDYNSRFIFIFSIISLISDYGGIVFTNHINIYFFIIFFCINEKKLDIKKFTQGGDNNDKERKYINDML